MGEKELEESQVFGHAGASLAQDYLSTEAYSEAEIDEAIRARGGVPAAIGKGGAALASRLLKQRRLSWMVAADRNMERYRALLEETDDDVDSMTGAQIQLELRRFRSGTSAPAVQALYRKRKPREANPEELRQFVKEARQLEKLASQSEGEE